MPAVERRKERHAANHCAQLEALSAHAYRAALGHCRLLAGHSRRSFKPRAVLPEKALDPGALEAHMKKVFGAASSLGSKARAQSWPWALSQVL